MFDKLIIYEKEEYGKDYIVARIELNDFEFISGYIRTTLEHLKMNQKYLKIITTDFNITETEYFENSVRSNKKGAAFIDRNGKKYYYVLGKEVNNPENMINIERNKIINEIC